VEADTFAISASPEALGARAVEDAEDAGAVALWGTWTLTLIVVGLIGIAVADELAIAHPSDDATLGFTVLAFGGPELFLLAQLLFHHAALGRAPRSEQWHLQRSRFSLSPLGRSL
jgi:low temperature requirement protein LtrA